MSVNRLRSKKKGQLKVTAQAFSSQNRCNQEKTTRETLNRVWAESGFTHHFFLFLLSFIVVIVVKKKASVTPSKQMINHSTRKETRTSNSGSCIVRAEITCDDITYHLAGHALPVIKRQTTERPSYLQSLHLLFNFMQVRYIVCLFILSIISYEAMDRSYVAYKVLQPLQSKGHIFWVGARWVPLYETFC